MGSAPLIRPIPTCDETREGKVKPYRFASKCAKCGRGDLVEPYGAPKDNDAFDAIKQDEPEKGKRVFLCRVCAVRAKKNYARREREKQ